MKRISLFIFAFIITISFLFVNVNADTKKYTTESVDFDVFLTEDGDAEITETWIVNYEKGEFTRFHKNIYMDLPKEEKIIRITDFKVEVDGEEYESTSNREDRDDRPEGKFYYGFINSDTYTYEVFFRKSEERVKIEVSYILNDVVKYIDNEYYLFVYRFLPKGYKDNIEDFSIKIRTENDNNGMKVLYKTKGDATTNDYVLIRGSNISDLYKVKVRINGDAFDNITQMSYINSSDVSNSREKGGSSNTSGGVLEVFFSMIEWFITSFLNIVFFVLVIGLFVRLINGKNRRKKQWKKEFEENPYMFEKKVNDIVESWIGKYFSPAMFVTQISKNYYFSFFAFLADLHSRQLINFSDDALYIYYFTDSRYYANGYDTEIFNLLEKIREYGETKGINSSVSGNCNMLPVNAIREYFSEFDNYSNLREILFKTVSSVDLQGEEKKRFKLDREFVGYALELLPKKKIKYEDILYNYGRLGSAMDLLFFTVQDNTILKNDLETANISNLNDLNDNNTHSYGLDFVVASMAILSFDYYVEECAKRHINVNTRYSCSSCGGSSCSSCGSSCSSCSSCSGCGGCGGSD